MGGTYGGVVYFSRTNTLRRPDQCFDAQVFCVFKTSCVGTKRALEMRYLPWALRLRTRAAATTSKHGGKAAILQQDRTVSGPGLGPALGSGGGVDDVFGRQWQSGSSWWRDGQLTHGGAGSTITLSVCRLSHRISGSKTLQRNQTRDQPWF